MKSVLGLRKTTILGGLFVVLPVVIVVVLLAKAVTGVRAAAGSLMATAALFAGPPCTFGRRPRHYD